MFPARRLALPAACCNVRQERKAPAVRRFGIPRKRRIHLGSRPMRALRALAPLAVLISAPAWGQAPSAAALPKVALVGDSIRLGYGPKVAERLKGRAVVLSLEDNGGDSGNVLAHLEEWILREKPDVVHLNCGLHDLKRL